jgi:hypothetical protein
MLIQILVYRDGNTPAQEFILCNEPEKFDLRRGQYRIDLDCEREGIPIGVVFAARGAILVEPEVNWEVTPKAELNKITDDLKGLSLKSETIWTYKGIKVSRRVYDTN